MRAPRVPAGRVAARPAATLRASAVLRVQRSCACGQHTAGEEECTECRRQRLQRRAAVHGHAGEAPPIVREVLSGPGQPLDLQTRAFMEPRFGHDFSRVRVHADGHAAESARAVGALAYTVGHHIVFDAGQHAPATMVGRRLMAHELAHVVQQTRAAAGALPARLAVDAAVTPAERDADAIADRVIGPASGHASPDRATSGPLRSTVVVQRRVSPRLATIRDRLETGWFNSVTDAEAHEVLIILKDLAAHSDVDFRDTVAAMEREGLVARFLSEVGKDDRRTERETLRRVSNARVFTRERRAGGSTVTTTVTGSCSPERFERIASATRRGLDWLNRAIGQTDAFLSAPAAPGNAGVRDALRLHFKSVAPAVVRHVRGRLHQIRTDIRTAEPFTVECHDAWDITCRTARAYIPGGEPERMVFCTRFFSGSDSARSATIVHEAAHTQVGGVHITDLAYDWERLLRYLTTEEALINAESYSLYVEHLATGRAPRMAAPRDTREDCPDAWWELLQRAIARAQKANSDADDATERLTAARVRRWTAARRTLLGGTTQADIDRANRVYRRAYERLQARVDFECEPGGGGRCGGAEAYWYATGDLHICPSWRALATERARVISLLSAMYGYFDLEGNDTRRTHLARLAVELTTARREVPSRTEILGDPGWTSNRVRIHVTPIVPAAPAGARYVESGTRHTRVSTDLPVYLGPDFQSVPLPFRCEVLFAVDLSTEARPSPFTPPRASVLFDYTSRASTFRREERDPRVDYAGAGAALDTTFPTEFTLTLRGNGTLHLRFELADPDSGVTRVYDDRIQVEADRLRDIPAPGRTQVA